MSIQLTLVSTVTSGGYLDGDTAGRKAEGARMLLKMKKNTVGKRASEKGAAQIEFALVATILFVIVFGIVEMERMLLVYTTLANSSRAATRYAIVHGSDRTGTGVTGASSSAAYGNVQDVVTYLAGAGTLNPANLTITVAYTKCAGCTNSNDPGSTVSVNAVYAYDPFFALPLRFNLSSTSEGVITF